MNKLSKNAWVITALILLLGFLFLELKIVDYGYTFFILFPLAVGFSIGTLDKKKRQLSYILLGTLIFFGFLLAGKLEGLICVLMALPLFILMIYIGYRIQKRYITKHPTDSQKLLISIAPLLLLLLCNPVERILIPHPELVTITSSLELNYHPNVVFDAVKQMDTLDAEKPFAMMLGLPAPYQCVLDADTIGAKRHCLFENGEITAVITRYEKGKVLEMNVTDYTLTGREWFHFIDATYTFKSKGGIKEGRRKMYDDTKVERLEVIGIGRK